MTELWLKFKDENGAGKRILVRGEKFAIGRYPENDLCIPRSELSRCHAEIDRFDDVYVLSDNNSSNGTTVNGVALYRPSALGNGDRINLGGSVEIEVELISTASEVQSPAGESKSDELVEGKSVEEAVPETSAIAAPAATQPKVPAPPVQSGSSIFRSLFILAPILVIVILVFAGGLLLILGGGKKKDVVQNTGTSYSKSSDDDFEDEKPNKNKKEDSKESATPSPKSSSSDPVNSLTPVEVKEETPISTPKISSESDKIERNAYPFLRRIANADQNPVLTSKQINLVNTITKSFSGSTALQGNLQDLKKKSAEIESLAKSKSLKPQFLAAAALAQLGTKRGDPLAAAQSMAGVLNQLSNTISNDLSSDSLIIMAAFEEDSTGNSKMPSRLANLSVKFPNESPQTIRSIWFLHDKDQITDPQFEFALRFLAIGAIMQNPKDFNINAEPVVF